MTIFIVSLDFGQWSDAYNKNSAVFDNEEMATKYKDAVEDHYKKVKATEPPFPRDDYYGALLTEEQDYIMGMFLHSLGDAEDFNGARIESFQLNFPEPQYL